LDKRVKYSSRSEKDKEDPNMFDFDEKIEIKKLPSFRECRKSMHSSCKHSRFFENDGQLNGSPYLMNTEWQLKLKKYIEEANEEAR